MNVNSVGSMQQMQHRYGQVQGGGNQAMKEIMQQLPQEDRQSIRDQMQSLDPSQRKDIMDQISELDTTNMSADELSQTLLSMFDTSSDNQDSSSNSVLDLYV